MTHPLQDESPPPKIRMIGVSPPPSVEEPTTRSARLAAPVEFAGLLGGPSNFVMNESISGIIANVRVKAPFSQETLPCQALIGDATVHLILKCCYAST